MKHIERLILADAAQQAGVTPAKGFTKDLPNGRLFGFVTANGKWFMATAAKATRKPVTYDYEWALVDAVSTPLSADDLEFFVW